jgi:predicted N-acetyltransferase YhbS
MHFNAAMVTIVIIRLAKLWVRIPDAGRLVFGVGVIWEANVGQVEVHGVLVFVTVLHDALADVMIAPLIVAPSQEATT